MGRKDIAYLVAAISLSPWLGTLALRAASPPNPVHLLDASAEHQQPYSGNVAVESEVRYSTSTDGAEARHGFRRAKTWLSNGRIHVQNDTWPLLDEPYGETVEGEAGWRSESLWPFSDEIRGIAISDNLQSGTKVVIAAPKRTASEARLALSTVDAGSSRLRGFMFGDDASAVVLMRDLELAVRPERERIDGSDCWVVEGRGEHGHYTAWFDMTRHGALRRIEVAKSSDSRFSGRRLSDPDPDHARFQPTEAKSQRNIIKTLQTTLEISQFALSGEIEYPTEGKVTTIFSYADGHSRTVVEEVRQRITTDPEKLKEHRFEIAPIPNGTEVAIRGDTSGVPHEWRDGKIVAHVDKRKVKRMRSSIEQLKREDVAQATRGGSSPDATSPKLALRIAIATVGAALIGVATHRVARYASKP